MKRDNIFGRSAGAVVFSGLAHGDHGGRREQPQHHFTPAGVPADPHHRRRQQDPVQDTATYHCSCGLVFEAAVDTTVGCPHCGTGQAW